MQSQPSSRSGAPRSAASASGRPMPPPAPCSRRAQACAAASPSRTAPRSRGSPRCRASREMARAMSGAVRSSARAVLAQGLVLARARRRHRAAAAIVPGSRSGLASRAASSRAPGPVTVRSMAASRLPCRSPPSERSSSRLARLGASMTRRLAGPVLRGGRRQGRLPICVSSTYLRSAPTAASSGREKSPKAARSATPSWALSSRSPARLSKEAAGTGVGAAPAMPIH